MMCKACNVMDSPERPHVDELCNTCLAKVKEDLRWFGPKAKGSNSYATKKAKNKQILN